MNVERRDVISALGWAGVLIGYLLVKAGERWMRNRKLIADTRAKLIAGSGDLDARRARMRRGEFMETAETNRDAG